jgi:hypothetical protein
MENIDLATLLSGKPEIYAILLVILYGLKKVLPLYKQGLALKQSILDCLMRIELGGKEGIAATQENTRAIKALDAKIATKDDIINVLLKSDPISPPPPALNGSGALNKQAI